MNLNLKRKVGRPSKKQIRKEKTIKVIYMVSIVAIIGLLIFAFSNLINEESRVNANVNTTTLNIKNKSESRNLSDKKCVKDAYYFSIKSTGGKIKNVEFSNIKNPKKWHQFTNNLTYSKDKTEVKVVIRKSYSTLYVKATNSKGSKVFGPFNICRLANIKITENERKLSDSNCYSTSFSFKVYDEYGISKVLYLTKGAKSYVEFPKNVIKINGNEATITINKKYEDVRIKVINKFGNTSEIKGPYNFNIQKSCSKPNSGSNPTPNNGNNQTPSKTTTVSDKNLDVSGVYTDSSMGKKVTYTTIYNDSWFTKSTTVKNENLATLSMFASASVYQLDNAQNLLKNCNFTSSKTEKTVTKTDNDHVSYVIGHKKIGNFTVVAVIVKGTSGNYEWVSNFNIGKNTTHKGFELAEKELNTSVNNYIKNNNITGTIKYWVTGHSRGAAVANLYAKRLNSSGKKTKVYAYTFATPRVSRQAKLSGYENIYNYINTGDFVTEVAPTKWGFKRYGNDIFIDDSGLAQLKNNFRNIVGVEYGGYSKDENQKLIDSFVDYSGNNQTSYYTKKNYKNYSASPSEYFQDGIALILAGDTVEGSKTVGKIIAKDSQARTVTKYLVAGTKVNDKMPHAHCVSTYVSWVTSITNNSKILSTDSN